MLFRPYYLVSYFSNAFWFCDAGLPYCLGSSPKSSRKREINCSVCFQISASKLFQKRLLITHFMFSKAWSRISKQSVDLMLSFFSHQPSHVDLFNVVVLSGWLDDCMHESMNEGTGCRCRSRSRCAQATSGIWYRSAGGTAGSDTSTLLYALLPFFVQTCSNANNHWFYIEGV